MKKTLAALMLSAAVSQPLWAANFTVYGVADTGLGLKRVDDGVTNASSLGVISGYNAGSRFGFKGEEDLGDGMKVAFRLENGFTMDDGRLGNSGRLFGREARVTVSGGFGEIAFGHIGGLNSAAGYYDVTFVRGDAFDGGDNAVATGFAMTSRADKTVLYATPQLGAAKLYAQYSFEVDGKESEHSGQNERNAALALTFDAGALQTVLSADAFLYGESSEQGYAVNAGGNYDFGPVRVFAMLQYAQKVKAFGGVDQSVFKGFWKGVAAHAGATAPVAGGKLTAGLYLAKGETVHDAAADRTDVDYIGASARYVHTLSASTSVYAGAGVSESRLDPETGEAARTRIKKMQVYTGLTYKF